MKILALEFSSAQRSVAVVQGPAPNSALAVTEVIETGSGVTHALGMIARALSQAQVEREQIECLAIGLGPGSYHGVRAAIALAQGWHLGRKVKLLGLSSSDVVAGQAQNEGILGQVAVVIDAQRNEFYLADYELSAGGWKNLRPLRLVTLVEVQERQNAGERLIGPEVASWFPRARVVFPRAATLGQLAVGRNDFVAGEALAPIYLRETQFVKAPPPRVVPS